MKPSSWLFLLGLLSALTEGTARADNPSEFLAGMRREITVDPDPTNDKEPVEVRFPIKLPDAQQPGKVSVHALAATCGLLDASSFLKRVTGDVLADSASRASVLRLQIDLRKPVKPCIYDLKLGIGPPGAEPWFTAVEIDLPAARIEPSPKQVIEIIGDDRSHLPPLHLREASGRSRISIQDITQAGALRKDNIEISPQLRFTPPRSPIRADGAVDLTPELVGNFPLGTSEGTVRIVAPELSHPVDVAYEIRVRRSTGWICMTALVGLVIGWLLREVFARLIKLGDARRKADEALARLSAERRRRQDARFLAAVDERIEILTGKRWSNDEAEIAAAITEADAALKEAIKDWKERRDQASATYNGLKAILETKYHLPPALRARIAAAAEPLEGAGRRLNDGDAGGAADRLAAIEGELKSAVTTLGGAWKTKVRGALADLAALPCLARDPSRGTTRDDLEAAIKEDGAKNAGMRERLERIDELCQKVSLFEVRLLSEIQTAVGAICAVASDAVATSVVEALEGEMARVLKRRQEAPDEPEEILSDIATTLHGQLRSALLGLLPAWAPKDVAQKLEELVEKGDYAAAAELVRDERVKPASNLEGTAQGEAGGTWPEAHSLLAPMERSAASSLLEALTAGAEPRAAGRVEVSIVHAPADAPPLASLLRYPWFLPLVRAATAAVVGVIVVFAAVATFEKSTFVGTSQELWSIFLWALGFNVVGAEALTTMVARISGRW
jgi:hypothetical protein